MHKEVCLAHLILGGSGDMPPRKILNFRPSKITSGTFLSRFTGPVATASVKRSFSEKKLIETWLRSNLSHSSLSHLMKIAIESPAMLTMTLKKL